MLLRQRPISLIMLLSTAQIEEVHDTSGTEGAGALYTSECKRSEAPHGNKLATKRGIRVTMRQISMGGLRSKQNRWDKKKVKC